MSKAGTTQITQDNFRFIPTEDRTNSAFAEKQFTPVGEQPLGYCSLRCQGRVGSRAAARCEPLRSRAALSPSASSLSTCGGTARWQGGSAARRRLHLPAARFELAGSRVTPARCVFLFRDFARNSGFVRHVLKRPYKVRSCPPEYFTVVSQLLRRNL